MLIYKANYGIIWMCRFDFSYLFLLLFPDFRKMKALNNISILVILVVVVLVIMMKWEWFVAIERKQLNIDHSQSEDGFFL